MKLIWKMAGKDLYMSSTVLFRNVRNRERINEISETCVTCFTRL